MAARKQSSPRGKRSSKRAGPATIREYTTRPQRFQHNWSRVAHVIAKMRSEGVSLRRAARDVGISPGTVLRWGRSALRKDSSGRFVAKRTDRLLRVLMVPTPYGPREIAVRNSRQATMLAEYWTAVQKYLSTGDTDGLAKFRGRSITDASGAKVPLLTELSELDRLGSAGVLSFESLYSRA